MVLELSGKSFDNTTNLKIGFEYCPSMFTLSIIRHFSVGSTPICLTQLLLRFIQSATNVLEQFATYTIFMRDMTPLHISLLEAGRVPSGGYSHHHETGRLVQRNP
ncbi:hypothetical protein M434DRAFT_149651 [Hypoxylon sp. CO27-5]|nr:hypothetical protein M434DRAFT_149651 [Hypoxylon sp. CO27-5]